MPAGIPECAPVGPPPIRGACRARPVPGANPTTGGAADTRRGKAPPHPLLRAPNPGRQSQRPVWGRPVPRRHAGEATPPRAAPRMPKPHADIRDTPNSHTGPARHVSADLPSLGQCALAATSVFFLRYLFPYGGMQNPSRVIRAFIRRIVENPGSAAVPAWP